MQELENKQAVLTNENNCLKRRYDDLRTEHSYSRPCCVAVSTRAVCVYLLLLPLVPQPNISAVINQYPEYMYRTLPTGDQLKDIIIVEGDLWVMLESTNCGQMANPHGKAEELDTTTSTTKQALSPSPNSMDNAKSNKH